MRKLFLFITIAFVTLASFRPEETIYKADARSCNIHWLGKKTTGQHDGDVMLQSGTLSWKGNSPGTANFVIDMTTITCTDIKEAEDNADFVKHLKNEDFFNVDKFPTATINIKKFERIEKAEADMPNFNATADLTIKGITHEVNFPVRIDVKGNQLLANANITIDRTKWNIVYKSKTIFSSLGDKFIYDDINFAVKLVMEKR